ncbi:Uncharacterized protein TPAR_05311 [Tolypocladium paradoxum]|uniref:RNA polymerase II subunit B1 CTD phosphatase RPAP2 homolog n=1 Tax=Tolypocladium paradoxum TaxID=94208 RepID=A0A2S4KWI8_9HYPO|nr:Uncharacterized protein TPAR_05311 [Tolypocladium paradoxum]
MSMDMDDEHQGTLKKTAPPQAASTTADAREVAIHHAKLLQHRKALESSILDSLILLSEYPLVRGPEYSAASPAPSDIASFKEHVRLFQPSDYSDLLEERHVNGLCGYTLCPKPHRDLGPGGEWKITATGIFRRKDLEMWCSARCAKRALFVKVQLVETGAWERVGIPEIQIDLLDEDGKPAETEQDRTARKLGEMTLEDQRHAAHNAAALALERGEPSSASGRDKVEVTLKEKDTQAPSPEAATSNAQDSHLLVEGHMSQLPFRPKRQH